MSRQRAVKVKRPADDTIVEQKKPTKRAKQSIAQVDKEESVQLLSGSLYVWGANFCGQFGFECEKRKFPALVPSLHEAGVKIVEVAAGGMHTVALSDDGKVYTFGNNDEGALGRLITSKEYDDQQKEQLKPTIVPLPAKVIRVTSGNCHSVALTDDGDVYCWGTFRDGNGKFGLIANDHEIEILPVKLELNSKVKQIASGNDHIVLLTEAGKVMTFGACMDVLGRTLDKRLRSNTNVKERDFLLTPKEAKLPRRKISQIWAGSSSSFCREEKAGIIWAFGMNSTKQLGFFTKQNMVLTPTKSLSVENGNFTDIAIGEFHCLGLNAEGRVYSWGKASDGQLGLGDATPEEAICEPTLVPLETKKKVIRIACGHSVSYALTSSSTLYSWGFGDNWQLGYGDDEDQKEPTPVLAKMNGQPAKSVKLVSGGGQHVCIVADFGLGMETAMEH